MDQEVLDNHARYQERKNVFARFGYDVDKERAFILEKAQPLAGRILEAGTGKGHFALELAKEGFCFTTFDISEVEQHIARLNLAYYGLEKQIDFRVENGESLRFPDKSFDVILSVNTLHHLADPRRVIDELIRVLADTGKLVLSDFTPAGLAVVDKIHAAEGHTHEVAVKTLADIQGYVRKKRFAVDTACSEFQEVLIAQRRLP
jgi:ubiquinone/menaquinone biosynthesis C-methylase UbiE